MGNAKRWLLAGLVTILMAGATEAWSMTLYLSPTGNDRWSGQRATANGTGTDGPLASLQGARDRIRQLRANGYAGQPMQVLVADGVYRVTAPVAFTPEDSGTAAAPVVFEAAPGAKPRFSGGEKIGGWRAGEGGIWTAQVPRVAEGQWYFEQLWINGKRAVRARTPNQFWSYVQGKVDQGLDPATGQEGDLSGRGFKARKEDFAILRTVPQDQMNDVVVVTDHSWETSRSRLAGIDPATRTVVVTAPIPWGFAWLGANCRYHLENLRAALDEPGEWFLDRDGTLSYMPRPGEDMTNAEVVAPAGPEQFVTFVGQPELGLAVEHITLRGLSFEHGNYTLPPEGHGDGQAEVTISAAIVADGARNLLIEDCGVKHVGVYGAWFRHGCRDCTVRKTWFEDLGAGGVKIGEGWGPDLSDPAAQTGHITVDNCIVHTGGRIHHGCIGVWIGHSGDNQVTHNDISDLYYTGVSVGWSWGYAPTISHNNHIDFNHISHLGQGMLSDMGGVYTLGLSDGTTVNNNVIHDVHDYGLYGRGGWGLYNDEGTSRITMENNLVYSVKTGTYHQHYGEDNVVRNNIFAYSMDGQIQRSRIEDHNSFFLTNNIILWKGGELYTSGGGFHDTNAVSESNLYWREDGPVTFHGASLEDWQAQGREKGSVVADPLFVDPENGDFHFREGAPYAQIGFKPFDYTQAGLYGDEAWKAIPRGFDYAPVEFAPPPPPPPPMVVHEDFERYAVGARPDGPQCNTENKGDDIRVTDVTAASGTKSLLIQDAPGLQYPYDPHLVYTPNHNKGTTKLSYDMRLEEGANLYNEWRSWDVQPYRVGPSFTIEGNLLIVWGEEVAQLPVGEWFHVEIEAAVGEDVDGTWKLTVTLKDQEPQVWEGLRLGNADFRNLSWVGWSSMATETTSFYLDNIELVNSEWKAEE